MFLSMSYRPTNLHKLSLDGSTLVYVAIVIIFILAVLCRFSRVAQSV
jgi:hypothetical protein